MGDVWKMQHAELTIPRDMQRSARWFALYLATCAIIFIGPLHELFRLSLSADTYSHLFVVPIVVVGLLYTERAAIFREATGPSRPGLPIYLLLLAGVGSAITASVTSFAPSLALYVLGFLIFLWAGFAWAFGWRTFRAALFPLAFLMLMIPPPASVLERLITWLQWGSADLTAWFFHLAMTPVVREGLVFDLPGVTIEVARECSGIRSSIALAITCLAAGYLFLRMRWTRTVFWMAILPIAIVKNGIRIATLSLLAVHVDPGFLFGRLHQYGGFLFFGIGLALLWCLLRMLQRMEQARSSSLL